MRKVGLHTAYFISQCSDAPEHLYRLARAFTAHAHALKGRLYGIFFQPMLRLALMCVQSCQNLYCSRSCAKWAYIRHIFSANTQTRLSIHAVLPEPSLLSNMHKMGIHTAYFISQCSDAPEHSYRLARAFTALAHAQNGRSYGIFFQPMLRRALACVQSCQNLHCSRTCSKWVYKWHLLSVNAHTSLSMRAVSPGPSLLSHTRKMGIHTAYSISQCSNSPKHACSLARAFTALAHAQNGRIYGIFFQSILRRVFMQSCQSLHCSHTCAKWAYIRHISSVNALTRLSICTV